MTRMCARLEIRTGRLGQVASRKGARSASEMQSCWLVKDINFTDFIFTDIIIHAKASSVQVISVIIMSDNV